MAAVLSDHNSTEKKKDNLVIDQDDDNEDLDEVIADGEQLDQKKKKKKKKKKKSANNANEENAADIQKGLKDISINDNSSNQNKDTVNGECLETNAEVEDGVKGGSDQNKKKKKKNKPKSGSASNSSSAKQQTYPPSIPISELFPDGNFPVGQEMEYPSVSQDRYSTIHFSIIIHSFNLLVMFCINCILRQFKFSVSLF